MLSHEGQQFQKYHESVRAERYRVTCIRMKPDGSRATFILDKRDGVTQGFTPDELLSRIPEMQRLQQRGENLYYTPLSATKHHILIDDMDRAKAERFVKDGYRPAALIESSPRNYQMILTLPKLGSPHDRDIGNRLSDKLNQSYGDPKLSGCIHPHRAPCFDNRKPKHRCADGSYPVVRLLKAEARECQKAFALTHELQEELNQRKLVPDIAPILGSGAGPKDAYWQHFRDVSRLQSIDDLSRVDSMIAVRMRITGHAAADIEAALRECAPQIRSEESSRNWDDYAARTTRFAFGPGGDSHAMRLAKYQGQWQRLEQGKSPDLSRTIGQSREMR